MSELSARKTWWWNKAAKAVYYILALLNALLWAILLLKGIIALVATNGSAESLFGTAYPLASVIGSLAILVVGTLVAFALIDKWCRGRFRRHSPKRTVKAD